MMLVMLLLAFILPGKLEKYASHRGQAYFSSLPGRINTQSNITSIIFTWVHYTNTEKKSWSLDYIDIEGTRFGSEISHTRTDLTRVAQLAEHWAGIPKVVGSFPTVARHIFQAYPVG